MYEHDSWITHNLSLSLPPLLLLCNSKDIIPKMSSTVEIKPFMEPTHDFTCSLIILSLAYMIHLIPLYISYYRST